MQHLRMFQNGVASLADQAQTTLITLISSHTGRMRAFYVEFFYEFYVVCHEVFF
jgi:hypothetical protein